MDKEFFATIDVGSNAIRMMVVEKKAGSPNGYQIVRKQRAQLRLGHDVFRSGVISPLTMQSAKQVFLEFKEIIDQYPFCQITCAATSATREAKNRADFVNFLFKETGIKIEIIDGTTEGNLIFLAIQKNYDLAKMNACLLDIGGGSIEISFAIKGNKIFTQSFPLGTVRLIEELNKRNLNESSIGLILGENIEQLMKPIIQFSDEYQIDCLIGTGGNIECLGDLRKKICKNDDRYSLNFNELGQIIQTLQKMNYDQRRVSLNLRADRADVIVPASLIVHLLMRQLETQLLIIPHVGLRDGLIYQSLHK